MKKIASLILCMVLVLSLFGINAAAAETTCMDAAVTVSDDGIVTVAVSARQTAANARLVMGFDPAYLTFVGYETAFAVHSAKVEGGKVTVGLASASANAVASGEELIRITFEMTGGWDKTEVSVTAENYGGEAVNENLTLTVPGSGYRFQDVKVGTWYYEAVDAMAAAGYILGVSETRFGAGLNMNRASFVTLLGRMAGVENVATETRFADVPVESFYSAYVAWADEKGIVKGVSGSLFAPARAMSREQMVTFLYRYVVSEGVDVTVADAEAALSQFPDAGSVSVWAVDAFAWAIDRGIINGMDGMLAPQRTCNRAQVAVMLYRYLMEGGSK